MQLKSVSVALDSQVTLLCPVTGCPAPEITWYKDNVAISTGPNMVIQAATLSDRGFYACKAVNEYGYALSNEARVSIIG